MDIQLSDLRIKALMRHIYPGITSKTRVERLQLDLPGYEIPIAPEAVSFSEDLPTAFKVETRRYTRQKWGKLGKRYSLMISGFYRPEDDVLCVTSALRRDRPGLLHCLCVQCGKIRSYLWNGSYPQNVTRLPSGEWICTKHLYGDADND